LEAADCGSLSREEIPFRSRGSQSTIIDFLHPGVLSSAGVVNYTTIQWFEWRGVKISIFKPNLREKKSPNTKVGATAADALSVTIEAYSGC